MLTVVLSLAGFQHAREPVFIESEGKMPLYLHTATRSLSLCGPDPGMHKASVQSNSKIH